MTNYSDPIIFGKAQKQKIVSIEPSDGQLELFIKQDDGSTKSEFVTNKYWILASEMVNPSWTKLKGNLHYKYGKQFTEIKDYYAARMKLKHKYDTYSIYDVREASMINKGYCYFQGLQPKDLSVLSFDIETTGITHNDNSKLLIIANTFRDSKGQITRKLFAYDEFSDEGEMIFQWCKWVRLVDPDVLVAHNGLSFDLPYIKYISDRYGITLDLGRDSSALQFNPYTSKYRIDGTREQEYNNVRCYGREIVDTYFGIIKWDIGKKLETYGLKGAISQLSLEVEGREFYNAAKIKDNYKNPIEWDKIKKYATFDGDDSLKLYDIIVPPYFYMNQSVPKSFQQMMLSASGSQINSMMVRSYLQSGHSVSKANDVNDFEGAISFGIAGHYSNAVRYDFSSMYPSIIRQYQICDKTKDPNSNFLKMADFFTIERLKNKKLAQETKQQYYKDLEQAQKIFANSLYGFLSSRGLNYNYPKGADEVTRRGRELLKFCVQYLTGKTIEEYGYLPNSQLSE